MFSCHRFIQILYIIMNNTSQLYPSLGTRVLPTPCRGATPTPLSIFFFFFKIYDTCHNHNLASAYVLHPPLILVNQQLMELIHSFLNLVAPPFTFFSLCFFLPPFYAFKFFLSTLSSILSEDVSNKVVLITAASSGIGEV